MAGYAGYSKSNNALTAESEDKTTKGLAVRKIQQKLRENFMISMTQEIIRKHEEFYPCEWHHTSKMYNRTDYYDVNDITENIAYEFHKNDLETILSLPFSQWLKDIALRDDLLAKNKQGIKTELLDFLQVKKYPELWTKEEVLALDDAEKAKSKVIKVDYTPIDYWLVYHNEPHPAPSAVKKYFGMR